MKELFKQLLSSDERRISSLILFAFVLTGLAAWTIIFGVDVPPRLADLLIWLYGFIATGSAANVITRNMAKPKIVREEEEENNMEQ